ncbi:PRC-barrel domain-containing protein [Acaryochloris sp. CCMEE 5410]|uniref:PRC-barrel domain-containing protein n=1 Tax=Acaryochloris sp. CCMEE 5410 TaxID=310037 RepID=UPI0002483AD1|nr:PRC-barrel domain-containing protein [Acaryochloris sp. CCMEE 5410]KAI9134506.1 PRC-barrel domain-containing protein [Acaryochloris sp. CCMEE 5410]
MADAAKIMRHSQLLNRLVIDRDTTEELGRIDVVWMHPPAHRVMGFICKPGFMTKQRYAFNLKQLYRIGPESILVSSGAAETNVKEVALLETLIGLELWTDAGERLGRIIDCLFDRQTGNITHYLFKSGGWRGFTSGVYQLPPRAVMSFGRKKVLVTAKVSANLKVFQEGLEDRLVQVSDLIKSGYTQELDSLTSRAQKLTQQAEERLQKLAEQANEQVEAFGQAEEEEDFGQQLQEKSQKLMQQAKQKGRALWERVEDGAFNLTEELANPEESRPASRPNVEAITQEDVIKNIPIEDLEDDEPWI